MASDGSDEEKLALTPEALDRIRDGLKEWIDFHVKRRRSFSGVEDIREHYRAVYDRVMHEMGLAHDSDEPV